MDIVDSIRVTVVWTPLAYTTPQSKKKLEGYSSKLAAETQRVLLDDTAASCESLYSRAKNDSAVCVDTAVQPAPPTAAFPTQPCKAANSENGCFNMYAYSNAAAHACGSRWILDFFEYGCCGKGIPYSMKKDSCCYNADGNYHFVVINNGHACDQLTPVCKDKYPYATCLDGQTCWDEEYIQ